MALTRLWGERGAIPDAGADGADGNARLTGAVGLVLLVVLFVEGITILEVRQLITLHIFVGLMLIPPTALKFGSTLYRFIRYYTHSPSYVRHGPPHPLLRWTAPLLVIFTGAVLLSGVVLIILGPDRPGQVLGVHKASFIIWFALMALHVLGHIKDAVLLFLQDWWPRTDRASPRVEAPRGKRQRGGLVVVSLVAGVVLAVALLPVASPWTTRQPRHDGAAQPGHPDVAAQGSRPGVIVSESRWP